VKRYRDLNTHLRGLFGCRVQKISLDAGLTCPNRDGTLSTGGCIYCNPRGSGTGAMARGVSIRDQVLEGKAALSRRYGAGKFIAYFQSFSNTYGPPELLRRLWDEALADPDVVGLSVGTRPDCVDAEILDPLASYRRLPWLCVEYGLQSAHDDTLRRIRRGHDFEAFRSALEATAKRSIPVCVHVILGLPGETAAHMRETASAIAGLPIDGIKIHLLYVVKGTPLEGMLLRGEYRCLEQAEYVERVCEFLERIPPHWVVQRLTGDPHPGELAAPEWSLRKRETLERIERALETGDTRQGRLWRGGRALAAKGD